MNALNVHVVPGCGYWYPHFIDDETEDPYVKSRLRVTERRGRAGVGPSQSSFRV